MSKILKYVKFIFSFVNIFIIIKGFINFDNNYFLYDPAFNNNYDAYPKDQRIEGLKKIKFAPFEYYEERIIHHTVYSGDYEEIKSTIIITDESKFNYFNYSKKYINFKKEKSTIPIFEDDNFGDLLLYLLAEILEMLGALNWGSVGTKVEKLIDEKIETRLEDYGEEKDCIANFILTMRGKKFIGFSIIVFIIDFVYLGLASFLNQEWLNNEIVYFSFYLDLIDLVFFFMYLKSCCLDRKGCVFASYAFCLFIIMFLIVEFFSCILSFYSIYYSIKEKTFFYYHCKGDIFHCEDIFSYRDDNGIHPYNLNKDHAINEGEIYYFYFKIYLKKGEKTFVYIGMIIRAIMLVYNIVTIANYLIYLNICGGFNNLKKVVCFIRNADGTFTDLKDISIKEKKVEYEGGNAADESNVEKKAYKLERICNKKTPINMLYTQQVPIVQSQQNNNKNNQVNILTTNNGYNYTNNLYTNMNNNNYNQNAYLNNNNFVYGNRNLINNNLLYFNMANSTGRKVSIYNNTNNNYNNNNNY